MAMVVYNAVVLVGACTLAARPPTGAPWAWIVLVVTAVAVESAVLCLLCQGPSTIDIVDRMGSRSEGVAQPVGEARASSAAAEQGSSAELACEDPIPSPPGSAEFVGVVPGSVAHATS